MIKLSIIIPAYNEEVYIEKLLNAILNVNIQSIGFETEIIIVDNGSTDRTYSIASSFSGVRCLRIKKNRGKGGGIKFGIENASGEYILIQDADLEYDPRDYIPMLHPIRHAAEPLCIYGSRILGELKLNKIGILRGKHKEQSLAAYIANILLSLWILLLYKKYISDPLTGYKVYPANILHNFNIKTFGFETDHELTAKLIRSNIKIIEVPISYCPRTIEEGKKIRTSDFFVAIWTFLKFRFVFKKNF